MKYFNEAFDFINNAKDNKCTILIHCQMGKSRSATILIAYLMKFYNYSYDGAFNYVKKLRKIVNPNAGFVKQLKLFEKFVKNKGSWHLL